MRDAIGSTWLLGIIMAFMILFIGYISIAINLAKSFQVKNAIVTMVENNEGYSKGNDEELENKIRTYLSNQGYSNHGLLNNRQMFDCVADGDPNCESNCLITNDANQCEVWIQKSVEPIKQNNISDGQVDPTGTNSKTIYRITTFFKLEIPAIDVLLSFPVSSDTRAIFDFSDTTGGATP